jgi:hypothetical protein
MINQLFLLNMEQNKIVEGTNKFRLALKFDLKEIQCYSQQIHKNRL